MGKKAKDADKNKKAKKAKAESAKYDLDSIEITDNLNWTRTKLPGEVYYNCMARNRTIVLYGTTILPGKKKPTAFPIKYSGREKDGAKLMERLKKELKKQPRNWRGGYPNLGIVEVEYEAMLLAERSGNIKFC